MINNWMVGIVLGLSLSILSCSNNSTSNHELKDALAIVIINDEEVSLEQFKAEFKFLKKRFRVQGKEEILPQELAWLKNRVLEQIVQKVLLKQEIKKNEIVVSQETLDEEILKAEAGYPDDSFVKQLEFEGLTRAEWANIIEYNLLIKELIRNLVNSKVSIGEDEMLRYFVANEAKYQKGEQVRALHIMVETEEEIRQILKELKSKKKDFAKLAKEFSLGPEGSRGGDLGYFEVGQMPEEFDNVFKLKVDSVSDIIRTPYGFHLFKVIDKVKERKMSFDESKKQVEQVLRQELQDKAFQSWFVQLKDNSTIEIKYDLLEKIN
jgi:parvulin-like peptidyl-prolyl isomerase